MFSAKKIRGVRLYKLARQKKLVEREPIQVFIKLLELIDYNSNSINFLVSCSKGTYVRQLGSDIAKKLAASNKRGRNVYQKRAGCTECHMWDGVGGEDTNVATLVGLTLNSEEIQKVVACGLPETSMWAFAPSAFTGYARSMNAPKQISGRFFFVTASRHS